jgi:hypothetical protein
MRFYVLVAIASITGFLGTTWAARSPMTFPVDVLPSKSAGLVAVKPSNDGQPSPGQLLEAAAKAARSFNETPCDAVRKAEMIRTASAVMRLSHNISTCRDGGCDEATKSKFVALMINLPLQQQMHRALRDAHQSGGVNDADWDEIMGTRNAGRGEPAPVLDCTPGAGARNKR